MVRALGGIEGDFGRVFFGGAFFSDIKQRVADAFVLQVRLHCELAKSCDGGFFVPIASAVFCARIIGNGADDFSVSVFGDETLSIAASLGGYFHGLMCGGESKAHVCETRVSAVEERCEVLERIGFCERANDCVHGSVLPAKIR